MPEIASFLSSASIDEVNAPLREEFRCVGAKVPSFAGRVKIRGLPNYHQALLQQEGMFGVGGAIYKHGGWFPHWFSYGGWRGVLYTGGPLAVIVEPAGMQSAASAFAVFANAGLQVGKIYVLVHG